MPIKTVAACTLGCKVNQYDTDTLLSGLAARGFVVKSFNEPADLYLINTCTVTQTGDKKSRQMIRRAKRQNPSAYVAACGCLARLEPEALRQSGADIVFDNRNIESLLSQLATCGDVSNPEAVPPNRRTRAYIKIQDGCDRFCAYCIVPYARGPVVSRPPEDIVAEAEDCVRRGVQEIVLTGIHAASYGKDLTNINFPRIIERVAGLPGLSRLRLGSIEPYAADDAFLQVVAEQPRLCGHFHLSLQSGCDRTLRRMNRRYTAAAYAEAAARLRAVKPEVALTTDVIVGFPGETDADFAESLRFVEHIGFSRVHVFAYSPRAGTPAAGFPDQVPAAVKSARGKQMREVTERLARQYMQAHVGRTLPVLYETGENGYWEGHTDNYMVVRTASRQNLFNVIADTRLQSVGPDQLLSGVLEEERRN